MLLWRTYDENRWAEQAHAAGLSEHMPAPVAGRFIDATEQPDMVNLYGVRQVVYRRDEANTTENRSIKWTDSEQAM